MKGTESYVSRLFTEFFNSEKASGIILIVCTMLSIFIANSSWGESYGQFWHTKIGGLSVVHWINDALMAVFFLLVGLEIEREIYVGELSSFKNAMLPVLAAVGGMLVPAVVHAIFNKGTVTATGYGIPMATDIAFALGILSLAGKSVPVALKIFLTALAIIDDLGAIIIIAIFYTENVSFVNLLLAFGIFAGLFLMGKAGVKNLFLFLIPGIVMWYCMLQSGVHATITGVLLAFAIPFGDGKEKSPSYKLQHFLHLPVAFIIVPLFALANTGILLNTPMGEVLGNSNSLGILGGLIIGKPAGILLLCYLAIKIKAARMPDGVNWLQLAGAGVLAGIGFTMSIFITLLAFADPLMVQYSKIAILVASLLAGVAGYILIKNATNATMIHIKEINSETED